MNQKNKPNPLYPMRINKYLAWKKISTRRGADMLIVKKQVFINGKLALLGARVNEQDIVKVKGNKSHKNRIYFAYNKPIGIVTHSSKEKQQDIKQSIKNKNNRKIKEKTPKDIKKGISDEVLDNIFPQDIFPLGRLDKKSHGLILLTNDGRITDQLLSPMYFHEKEYLVKTPNKLRSSFKKKMEGGVNIEGYVTKKCKVRIINNFTFRVILTEGKKHQIRRMCSVLFQEVEDLKRERIMNIKLGNLKQNKYREIKGKELAMFLSSVLNSKF